MLLYLLLIELGCWVALATAAANCLPRPVPIKIGNTTLSNGKLAWGAEISVGTPPQNFAFLPQWPLNNLMVYGSNGKCQDDAGYNSESCTTFRGGSYKYLDSATYKSSSSDLHPGEDGHYPSDKTFYTDTVKLNDDVSLAEFPFFVPGSNFGEQRYAPLMAVGLGNESTLLWGLRSSRRIASRTWSFFAGLAGGTATYQLDGALVLGGYDRAKVRAGTKVTAPLAHHANCSTGVMVTVTNITMNLVNGTDWSIFQPGDKIPACIDPSAPRVMSLPVDYVDRFLGYSSEFTEASMDRSYGIHYFTLRYREGQTPYTGDLTIKLDSGLEIRIKNELLVTPHTDIDAATGATYTNATGPDLLLLSLQGGSIDDLAGLGYHFLQAAYLSVNQDAGAFALWEAEPSRQSDLVALDASNAEVGGAGSFCAGPADDDGNPPTPDPSDAAPQGLAPGAIAGAAVGAAAAVVAAVVGGGLVLRRRRRRSVGASSPAELDPHAAAAAQPEKPAEAAAAKHDVSDAARLGTHEVPGNTVVRDSRSELA